MKFHVITLGCPKNAVDSEGMQGLLLGDGHRSVDSAEAADVVIVNTCSFIQAARDETVGVLRELTQSKRPGQRVIAAGCMAESHREQLIASVAGLDATVGTREWTQIPDVVARLNGVSVPETPKLGSGLIPLIPLAPLSATSSKGRADDSLGDYGDWRTTPIKRYAHGPSAYLKISDGCNLRCAFCSIPSFKGDMRSKPVGSILGEARELVEAGVQEIVLVAQHLTDYGRDFRMRDGLATLLDELCQVVPEDRWIRLLYAYPASITPGVMRAIADHPQICRYLDMPLQHAHPATLRRMRRPPDSEKTMRLIRELRETVPDIAIRSTFIVGFPGETREEFSALLGFLDTMEFDRAGFFRYSQEPGTPAATMEGQISERVKQRRFDQAMALQQQVAMRSNQRRIGQTLRILVEGEGTADDGTPLIVGRSYRDAPEIDGLVWAFGSAKPGTFAEVQVTQATPYDLWGNLSVPAGSIAVQEHNLVLAD